MSQIPNFKFALVEEVKDDKRFLPSKAEPLSTGYDVRVCTPDKNPIIIECGKYVMLSLGFRAIPEDGWWFQLNPRSSTFAKKKLHSLIGIIDNSYTGVVSFCAQLICDRNDLAQNLVLNHGDPIGQLIPFKIQDMNVEEVSNEEYDKICDSRNLLRKRGNAGGIGSTH